MSEALLTIGVGIICGVLLGVPTFRLLLDIEARIEARQWREAEDRPTYQISGPLDPGYLEGRAIIIQRVRRLKDGKR